jgi:hypothetical protein
VTVSMNWPPAAMEAAQLESPDQLMKIKSTHMKGMSMAFEGQSKIALPGNWKFADITAEVMEVIQNSLIKARSVIEAGGSWSPLVHILHPGEMVSVRFPGLSEDPREKDRIISQVSSGMKELNANVAIMITGTWVANETQRNSVTGSLQHPLPGSVEALMVSVWGPDGIPTCGAQMYRRCTAGKVDFEELKWEASSTE